MCPGQYLPKIPRFGGGSGTKKLRLRVSIVCTFPEFARPNRTLRWTHRRQAYTKELNKLSSSSSTANLVMLKILTLALLAMTAAAFAPAPRPLVSLHSNLLPRIDLPRKKKNRQGIDVEENRKHKLIIA